MCQACGAAQGAPTHRHFFCPAGRETRNTMPDATGEQVARASQCDIVWARGLIRDPAADWVYK